MPRQRNDNVEAFRCLLMFLIVLYHSWNHGIFGPDAGMLNLNAWWRVLFDAFLIWHIDGFLAISGWYGMRFSWRKFFAIYGTIAYYSVMSMLLWIVFDRQSFSIKSIAVTGGWFGGSYLMLMLCAPFVNAAVEHLASLGRSGLLFAWGLLAFGMTCAWLPHQGFTAVDPAGAGSHSFVCMVFLYVTARVARGVFASPIPRGAMLKCMAAYPLVVLMLGGGALAYNFLRTRMLNWSVLSAMSEYRAPHVWGFSLLVFLFFLWHVRVPKWLGRCCALVGPSTFSIYLIHDVMHNGALFYLIPQKWLSVLSLHPSLCIVSSACCAYFACIVFDVPRRAVVWKLQSILRGRCRAYG